VSPRRNSILAEDNGNIVAQYGGLEADRPSRALVDIEVVIAVFRAEGRQHPSYDFST
jgi:hypothetical protein